jgi:hypothetical protein
MFLHNTQQEDDMNSQIRGSAARRSFAWRGTVRRAARRVALSGLAAAALGLSSLQPELLRVAQAESAPWAANSNAKGELIVPTEYHDWVFLGSPLTSNAPNNGKAGFPEYHNVYVRREPLAIYRKTGAFPEGTMMLKELQLTIPSTTGAKDGSTQEPSRVGYFPGARNGLDISVKDSKKYAETKNWGFFTIGHHAPPYTKTAPLAAIESCAFCHVANATKDMVFTKFYTPILDAK